MDENVSNETGAETPAPPVPTPAYRRFRRRRTDKVISGICSGLGAYTGTDPVLWRLGFVVTAILSGGTAVLIYIVAAVLIPYGDSEEESPYASVQIDTNRWVGIGLLVLGVALLAGSFDRAGFWGLEGGFLWGLLLIGVGIALWNRGPRTDPESRPLAATSVATETVSRLAPPVHRTPRERSPLKRMTIGAVALALGSLMLLDSTDVVDLTGGHFLAAALLVVGAGLLVGAFWGRGRGLIWLGLPLTFAVAASVLIPVSLAAGAGSRTFRPTSSAEAESGYRLGVGDMHVDLTQVTNVSVPIELGAGELTVVIPAGAEALVRVRVTAGEIWLPVEDTEDSAFPRPRFDHPPRGGVVRSRMEEGFNLDRSISLRGFEDGGRIELDIHVGLGEINVVRGERTSRPEVFAPTPQPEPVPEEVQG